MKNGFNIDKFSTIGEFIARYGVVYILIAFGIFKFTETEAQAIKPLIDNSPIFNWMNALFSIRTISAIIGIIEIMTAIAIGSRFLSPTLSFYGSLLGSIIFFITLTFLFSTPGMIAKTEWLWLPDGFIIKDLVLLGFCLWSAGEAYSEMFYNQFQQNK
jgi:reactive chlorine resistance protein C